MDMNERNIALMGNPNVGKSTLFNALTGRHQHTGNWPGKTVELAEGTVRFKAEQYRLIDLPGTYSLTGCSREEAVAAGYLQTQKADCVLAVCDATNLERSLLLLLQILEQTERVVVCVNLLDEARRDGTSLDLRQLEAMLGVPVVGTSAGRREGLEALMERVRSVCDGFERPHPRRAGLPDGVQAEEAVRLLSLRAARMAHDCIKTSGNRSRTAKLDRIAVGKGTGMLLICALLLGVLWLTISGANRISEGLERLLQQGLRWLNRVWQAAGWPEALGGLLLDGVLGTTAKVVAVMLPPVMIFFPLFTLLEEEGYLPRVAYLLDAPLARTGGCGRQALTMCMGLGCNAVGVMGCRIIGTERERLLALLTNSLMPCNGRFPLLIALGTYLFAGHGGTLEAAICLTFCLLLAVWMTLAANVLLSRTVLRGKEAAFWMELPPYRMPRVGALLVRALRDRVLSVLARAAAVAAPAGAVIWALTQIRVGETALLQHIAARLQPIGVFFGMDGATLLAFALSWPANELFLPLLALIGNAGAAGEGALFLHAGWSRQTALCVLLFAMFHWPCSTTLLTVRRETASWKWTLLAAALPTAIGLLLCRLAAVG